MSKHNQPKWRDDPVETFSDWTIKIISSDDGDSSEIYHVHKAFLAHGPRRSEYFSRLFRSEVSFNENESNMSQIKLDPLAAKAFPDVLDYVYGADLNICTETATAQHHLGEYFEMSRLRFECIKFIDQDESLENVHIYYDHAKQLKDEAVMDFVTEFLRINIHQVRPTHTIVEKSDPQLWINALGVAQNKWNRTFLVCDTNHFSLIVAKVCMNQSEETLDAGTFFTLTDLLTSIDPSAALDLCEIADRYCITDKDEAYPSLSLLQERCVSTLSKNWQDLNGLDDKKLKKIKQRRPEFLAELLIQSLGQASRKVDELSTELVDCQKLLNFAQKIQWR